MPSMCTINTLNCDTCIFSRIVKMENRLDPKYTESNVKCQYAILYDVDYGLYTKHT